MKLQKKTSEIKCMDEKDKYFEIFQTDRNYISTIEPLILTVNYTVTNGRLVSRGILRPVRQNLGTQILQLHLTHIFYLKSLLTALSHSESTH